MTEAELDLLLLRSEGEGIDFKSQQYPFDGGREAKYKLVKDVLAMANSWHPGERYIIIGAVEGNAPPASLQDVSYHPDDAEVQQIVNGGKLNKPLRFSYEKLQVRGCTIGVIRVERQKRPFYLNKDFGDAKKDKVYVRRSSSNGEANPDEVAQMGAADSGSIDIAPQLAIELADVEPGNDATPPGLHVRPLPLLSRLPATYVGARSAQFPGALLIERDKDLLNLAVWFRDYYGSANVRFRVVNTSQSIARNACLEVRIDRSKMSRVETVMQQLRRRPKVGPGADVKVTIENPPSTTVTTDGDHHVVQYQLGDIRPGATVLTDRSVVLCALGVGMIDLRCSIYSDNLSMPHHQDVVLGFIHTSMDWDDDLIEEMRFCPLTRPRSA